jgi:hypothetical protein
MLLSKRGSLSLPIIGHYIIRTRARRLLDFQPTSRNHHPRVLATCLGWWPHAPTRRDTMYPNNLPGLEHGHQTNWWLCPRLCHVRPPDDLLGSSRYGALTTTLSTVRCRSCTASGLAVCLESAIPGTGANYKIACRAVCFEHDLRCYSVDIKSPTPILRYEALYAGCYILSSLCRFCSCSSVPA